MGLKPKNAVLQIRLDADVLARFQAACDARDSTISHVVRQFIHREIQAYEVHLIKQQLKVGGAIIGGVSAARVSKAEK